MTFIRLDDLLQNRALPQKIRQASHVLRIEHVNLEEKLIANVVAIKRYSFNERYVRNERCLSVVHVTAVTNSKRMID